MGDRWVLVEPGVMTGPGAIAVEGEEAHHLTTVTRCKPGDPVILADGAGLVGSGKVVVVRKGRVDIEVGSLERCPRPESGVCIALAALHTQAMDWAVQKSVEVGVVELIPVVTERSQLSARMAGSRLDRWRKVARQALKQCRREWEMRIEEPISLSDLSARVAPPDRLVADPSGSAAELLEPSPSPVLLIGPEGGLSPVELRLLAAAGWRGVSLGPYTLRAETAVVAGATLLNARRAWQR